MLYLLLAGIRHTIGTLRSSEKALMRERGTDQFNLDPLPQIRNHTLDGLVQDLCSLLLELLVLLRRAVQSLEHLVRLVARSVGVHHMLACGGHARIAHGRNRDDHHVARRIDAALPLIDDSVVNIEAFQARAIDADMQVQDVAEMVWAQIKANDAAIKANKAAAEAPEEAEA